MKIEIKHRWSGEVLFECDAANIRAAVELAIKSKANLSEANLSGADLSGADLSKANLSEANLSGADLSKANLSWANLSWANLSGADLSKANLSGADLSGADLSWANLSWANLSGADLSWADLSKANLSEANLSWADLSKANLSEANLSGANLSWADLRIIKHDVWGVLLLNKNEVPALRDALVQGKVNGTVYSGECSCLCGTLAKAKGLDSGEELAIARSSSPAERFFLAIRTGDTPETNAVSKIALQWVDEFLALIAA